MNSDDDEGSSLVANDKAHLSCLADYGLHKHHPLMLLVNWTSSYFPYTAVSSASPNPKDTYLPKQGVLGCHNHDRSYPGEDTPTPTPTPTPSWSQKVGHLPDSTTFRGWAAAAIAIAIATTDLIVVPILVDDRADNGSLAIREGGGNCRS